MPWAILECRGKTWARIVDGRTLSPRNGCDQLQLHVSPWERGGSCPRVLCGLNYSCTTCQHDVGPAERSLALVDPLRLLRLLAREVPFCGRRSWRSSAGQTPHWMYACRHLARPASMHGVSRRATDPRFPLICRLRTDLLASVDSHRAWSWGPLPRSSLLSRVTRHPHAHGSPPSRSVPMSLQAQERVAALEALVEQLRAQQQQPQQLEMAADAGGKVRCPVASFLARQTCKAITAHRLSSGCLMKLRTSHPHQWAAT